MRTRRRRSLGQHPDDGPRPAAGVATAALRAAPASAPTPPRGRPHGAGDNGGMSTPAHAPGPAGRPLAASTPCRWGSTTPTRRPSGPSTTSPTTSSRCRTCSSWAPTSSSSSGSPAGSPAAGSSAAGRSPAPGSGCSSARSSRCSTQRLQHRQRAGDDGLRCGVRRRSGRRWSTAFTSGGQRDFTSVSLVVAAKYEVLCEHKHAQRGRELLAEMDPMRAAEQEVRRVREAEQARGRAAGQQPQQPPPAATGRPR